MTTVLLNVYGEKPEELVQILDIEDKLEVFYDKLQCNCIDIVYRKIGGKMYSIICDDEGLFRESPRISAITTSGKPILVGNLLFTNDDGMGELTSLDEDDIINIYMHLGLAFSADCPNGCAIIICDE